MYPFDLYAVRASQCVLRSKDTSISTNVQSTPYGFYDRNKMGIKAPRVRGSARTYTPCPSCGCSRSKTKSTWRPFKCIEFFKDKSFSNNPFKSFSSNLESLKDQKRKAHGAFRMKCDKFITVLMKRARIMRESGYASAFLGWSISSPSENFTLLPFFENTLCTVDWEKVVY